MNTFDNMTASEVADALAALGGGDRHTRSKTRRAVRHVLEPLELEPGDSWQHKWVAANADAATRDLLTQQFEPAQKSVRLNVQRGLRALIAAQIIRPGLQLMLQRTIARSFLSAVEQRHHADIDAVSAEASRHSNLDDVLARDLRYACAAMVVLTGKRLADIYPREWVAAERVRDDLIAGTSGTSPVSARRLVSLRTAYACCARAGLISPDVDPAPGIAAVPPTLERAKRQPKTLEALMEAHAHAMPPRIRALVFDVVSIDNANDISTTKGQIIALNAYVAALVAEIPGHDSLHVPIEVRDRLLRRIKTTENKNRRVQLKRTSVGHLLGRVKVFYSQADWVVGAYELDGHRETLGVFPWSPATLRKIAKNDRQHRDARLTAEVLDQVNHLDGLVAAANAMLDEADRFAARAHGALPGETFTFEGTTYLRSLQKVARQGSGRTPVTVTNTGKAPYRDVDLLAFRAAQIRTLVVTLRESGIRAEELSDLALDHVIQVTDGDRPFPALNIVPSKQDRGRVVVLHPDVMHAIFDLRARAEQLWGTYPRVSRLDWHEGEDLPEARLVFFMYRNRGFSGMSQPTLAKWLQEAVNYYDEHLNPGPPLGKVRPHQMRRMFATDLGDRGVDPVAVQHTLGHKRLQTTSIYMKADQVSVIGRVVEARRQQKGSQRTSGTPEDTPTET